MSEPLRTDRAMTMLSEEEGVSSGQVEAWKGPRLHQSIGFKLAVIFLLLTLLPMGATAYYNLTQAQQEVATVARENLAVLSQSVAGEINQLLIENLRTAATLAGDPLVVQYLTATGPTSRTLEPLIYQTLENFAVTHPDFPNPGLIDARGIARAVRGVPQAVGRNYSDRDYFVAVTAGRPYISDVIVGRVTTQDGVFLAHPVITDGQIVGMSNMKLDVENNIRKAIDNVRVGAAGIAYLVDQDGVIIAHPDRSLLYSSLGELSPEATQAISASKRFGTLEDGRPRIPASLGIDELATALAAGRHSGSLRYYSPLDQRYHVVGYTRLDLRSREADWIVEGDWTVVVDLPEAQFLAPLQRLGTVAWISVGVVGIITLLISILLVRSITRPILSLSNAAIAVESGRPFQPASIANVTAGRDEIAYLGRVFSSMVIALRRSIRELRTVYRIGQDITATLEVDETLSAILTRVHDVIDYEAAEITLFDPNEKALIVAAWNGAEGLTNRVGLTYRLGDPFVGTIGQERRGMVVADATTQFGKEADSLALAADRPARSLLGVPLLIRDRLVGTLELASSRAGVFDENDRRLLETIAPQAAIAIEKAQQVREREQKLQSQIQQLRIEIDEAKRERQVSAITETEYFQQLSVRAARLRKRREEEQPGQ